MLKRTWSAFLLAVPLAACAGVSAGQPEFNSSLVLPRATNSGGRPSYTPAQYTSRILQPSPITCDTFDASPSPTPAQRNACIRDLLTDIDAAYFQYQISINNRIAGANVAFDAAALVAGTAAPAVSGTAAKVLSGIAAVANGGKSILSQDVLYKETIQVLLSTMDANRAKESAQIRLSMQSTIEDYPIEQARSDLLDYLYAGTLTNALAKVNQDSSATAQKCEAVAQAVKTSTETSAPVAGAAAPALAVASIAHATTSDQCNAIGETLRAAYNYTAAGKAIDAFWKPDGKTFSTSSETALKSCMTTALGSSTNSDVTGIASNGDIASLVRTGLVSEADKIGILACAIIASSKRAPGGA